MAKLTKAKTKEHDAAMDILSSPHRLSGDEIETVYRQYDPMATHNVGKNAVFFTPYDLAVDFSFAAEASGSVVDLCAGIGVLSHQMVLRGRPSRLVCVELNPEFVEIGKKLVPEAEWYCGSVFDQDLLAKLGKFDTAISNPPYGNIPTKEAWLRVRGPAQWQVIEVCLRLCYDGGIFIIPEADMDYSSRKREYRKHTNREKYLDKHFPGISIIPTSFDASIHRDQWKGAFPDVQIADVSTENAKFPIPYGLPTLEGDVVSW